MWGYYAKRWEIYIREATSSVISGTPFDADAQRAAIGKLQQQWPTMTEEVPAAPSEQDVLTHCRALREKYRAQLEAWANP